jgi:glucuronate isomerase
VTEPLHLHPDRLFPADASTRTLARDLYEAVAALPIISPHGHTDPQWFAEDTPFPDPAALLITPDHYVFRMLYSQGVPLEDLGIAPKGEGTGRTVETDPRAIWRRFAEHYHVFDGTPSQFWHDWVYAEVFGLDVRLSAGTADLYFDTIQARMVEADFRPRALMDRFNIELIATTEDPLDPLAHHAKIKQDGWNHRVITTFRPDNVLDPDHPGFAANLDRLGQVTGRDTGRYDGYLLALEERRAFFRAHGATATDHGHPTAFTADLSRQDAEALFNRVRNGRVRAADAETFRGHMLVEMARMSLDDGMVMQIHPGCWRSHNAPVRDRFGSNMGDDLPVATDFVGGLKALLNRFGNEPGLKIIVFTLDETTYSRELAPLAGHYPALTLGPPWWFHDSPEGMRRYREQMTETAGFYNTAGFNDDTRAFLSIPARHDVARRMDCAFLARLVAEHRLTETQAYRIARDLTYTLAKKAYRL